MLTKVCPLSTLSALRVAVRIRAQPPLEDDRSYDRGRDSPRGGDPRGGDSRARSASPDNRDDHGGGR